MKYICTITALVLSFLLASAVSAESPIQPGDRIAIVGNTFADQLRINAIWRRYCYNTREKIPFRFETWPGREICYPLVIDLRVSRLKNPHSRNTTRM